MGRLYRLDVLRRSMVEDLKQQIEHERAEIEKLRVELYDRECELERLERRRAERVREWSL